jgi:tripartite-type tricarboxylate transporter receptor subunit TctC
VFVENIAGAGGDVGSGDVFRSDPDGYTLLVTSPGFVTNQFVNKNSAWTPNQWSPISVLATTPYLLDTRLGFDGMTVKDVVAQAQAKPNLITYASGGLGSSSHLAAVQLETLTGIKMVHVPYRGAAPALNDLVAGRVDVDFDAVITTLPVWRDGKVKVLGVTSRTRSHFVPDVPTLAETGIPDFEAMSWTAMIAPPATPPAIVQKIYSGVRDVLNEPSVIERLRALNLDAVGSNPVDTAAYLSSEGARWKKIVGKRKISPE